MGTWSDEIFGNDLACDVRDEYRERVAAGDTSPAAVKNVKKSFAEQMQDADGKRTVWIALAAAQLQAYSVDDEVRTQALKAIAWCEHPDRDPEQSPFDLHALAKLRDALGGKATATKKSKPKVPPGVAGDVLAIRLPNSGEVLAIVTGDCQRGPHYAGVVLLRGLKSDSASERVIEKAVSKWQPYRRDWGDRLGALYGVYSVTGKPGPKKAKLILSGIKLPPTFAELVRGGGPIERAADLPHVLEHALWDWDHAKWKVSATERG